MHCATCIIFWNWGCIFSDAVVSRSIFVGLASAVTGHATSHESISCAFGLKHTVKLMNAIFYLKQPVCSKSSSILVWWVFKNQFRLSMWVRVRPSGQHIQQLVVSAGPVGKHVFRKCRLGTLDVRNHNGITCSNVFGKKRLVTKMTFGNNTARWSAGGHEYVIEKKMYISGVNLEGLPEWYIHDAIFWRPIFVSNLFASIVGTWNGVWVAVRTLGGSNFTLGTCLSQILGP